ncbi:acyltransferase [Sphingobacterium sp. DR205]|uniref:acyltransferase family protein n=1 Tax=Sphingobacterium sp. DR205 TaxID=2713573 RepID=UPI0013E4B400|nr:acyltransferase [Sphingobacterium sp. DR205]QIH31573.1 acyltransferase [Sphingobacterium sp. DR205]
MELPSILKHLKRDTGKKKFIPVIDGLRTLALMPVLLMHFNTNYKRYLGSSLGEPFDKVMSHGERGVFLFFAISGFILTLGLYNSIEKNHMINFKDYFVRRFTRLEPPFIISTVVLFIMVTFFMDKQWEDLIGHLIATLTYTHNLIFGYWSPINPVSWSLEVEIQFYILIPFFCIILYKVKPWIRILLIIAAIFILPLIFNIESGYFLESSHLRRSLPVFLSHFLVGVLFLNIFKSNFWKELKCSPFVDIIGAGAIYIYFFVEFNSTLMEVFVINICILAIFFSAFKGYFFSRLFSRSFFVIFGGMCYTIYLWHYPIFFGISKVSKYFLIQENGANFVIQFLFSVIVMTISCALLYLIFEKPFMKPDWWRIHKVGSSNLTLKK